MIQPRRNENVSAPFSRAFSAREMGILDKVESKRRRRKKAEHLKSTESCEGRPASSYNAGGFAAINSVNRLSLRNSANSTSLYTLLKSLYPNSSAFFRYSRDRSE